MTNACTFCGSLQAQGVCALVAALVEDDLDRALGLGLLQFSSPGQSGFVCANCTTAIRIVSDARDARLRALAARERYRIRSARLARREQARTATKRAAVVASPLNAADARTALPPAAAAALARAKAKAAGRT